MKITSASRRTQAFVQQGRHDSVDRQSGRRRIPGHGAGATGGPALGLPALLTPRMLRVRSLGEVVVAHGGASLEEVVVLLVGVKRVEP